MCVAWSALSSAKILRWCGLRGVVALGIEMRFLRWAIHRSGRESAQVLCFHGVPPPTSFHVATIFAPCLIRVFGPQEFLLVTSAGHGENVAILFEGAPCCDARATAFGCLDTDMPIDTPLMMRLRMGKFCGAAKVPSANSEISAPLSERTCSERRRFCFA